MRSRTATVAVLTVALLAGIGLVAFTRAVKSDFRFPGRSACVITSGGPGAAAAFAATAGADQPPDSVETVPQEVELTPQRLANASTIAAVGLRRGVPRRAVVIALATAFQESKLDNLAGGDRDSIGLFQQRPSQGWGTPEQISDPRYAANAFYSALLRTTGWQSMRITDAAQAVQRSAHPEAYQKWGPRAEALTRALTGEVAGAVSCTLPGTPKTGGAAAVAGAATAVQLDWGEVTVESTPDPPGVALPVPDLVAGWRLAHWLVSHAEPLALTEVRFAGRRWTATGGKWTTGKGASASDRVAAQVAS